MLEEQGGLVQQLELVVGQVFEERTLQGGVEDSGRVGDRVVGLVELVLDKGQGEDEGGGREDRVESAVEVGVEGAVEGAVEGGGI